MNTSLTLMTTFAKIGSFTFGGGYAMVGMIQKEVVEKQGWVEKDEFLELLTIAQTAPGPLAINTAAFVGYKINGYKGAFSAIFGSIIPSFIIIMVVAIFFNSIRENPTVNAVLTGIRPAVIALILAPSISLCKGLSKTQAVLAIVAAAALCYFGFSPAWLIVFGIVSGITYMLIGERFIKNNKGRKL